MTNKNNAISIVKVQFINRGFYIRLPAASIKTMHIRKGDMFSAFISRDKQSIRFLKEENPDDVIILPDPVPVEPEHIIVQQPEPAARHRLSQIMQHLFRK